MTDFKQRFTDIYIEMNEKVLAVGREKFPGKNLEEIEEKDFDEAVRPEMAKWIEEKFVGFKEAKDLQGAMALKGVVDFLEVQSNG